MAREKVALGEYWKYDDLELYVPGISNEIVLTQTCFCVERNYDTDIYEADKDCYNCDGKGIHITNSGEAILQLVKQFGEKND